MTISKKHVLCEHTKHFGISGKLQEIMCLLAQGYVFQEASEILRELLGVHMSAKQIQRLSEYYGQQLETQAQQQVQGKTGNTCFTFENKTRAGVCDAGWLYGVYTTRGMERNEGSPSVQSRFQGSASSASGQDHAIAVRMSHGWVSSGWGSKNSVYSKGV